jgi:hypothetical protein
MNNYRNSRIIPIALSLIVIAIAIAALVSLARFVFFSDSANSNSSKVDISKETLLSTSANHAVKMTVRGEIVADDNFRSYQIEITPNQRTLVTYNGYEDQATNVVTLENNIPAYEQFVYALYRANLIKGAELTGDSNDTRGVCATGYLYEFTILKDNKSVKHLWASSCSNARGSLSANTSQLVNLFTAQIPGYQPIIENLWQ